MKSSKNGTTFLQNDQCWCHFLKVFKTNFVALPISFGQNGELFASIRSTHRHVILDNNCMSLNLNLPLVYLDYVSFWKTKLTFNINVNLKMKKKQTNFWRVHDENIKLLKTVCASIVSNKSWDNRANFESYS